MTSTSTVTSSSGFQRPQVDGGRVAPHHRKVRVLAVLCTALVLAAIACVNVWSVHRDAVEWTPDALYYHATMLELRGLDHDSAMDTTFDGPLSAELRLRDPEKTGNAAWVAYNEAFYERRIAVPLAGAALYPLEGNRSLLTVSLAGYVAAVLAIFGLLLLRFRLLVAAAVALATIFLPPLVHHSSFPLTDSWGLALETVAFAAAILVLDRGLRWLPLWILSIALLAFTRDSTWIPILAVGWCSWQLRSRRAVWLFGTGIAAALPPILFLAVPVQKLLALLVNDSQIPSETSWWFILENYPAAVVQLVRANGGFLRDGEWYAALYLVGGVLVLLAVAFRGAAGRTASTMLMTAGAVASLLYVLAAPVFSAFRLELVLLPAAAYGIALAAQLTLARLAGRSEAPERPGAVSGAA